MWDPKTGERRWSVHPVAGAATFYLSVSPQIIYICFADFVHCTLRYRAITGWVIRFIF